MDLVNESKGGDFESTLKKHARELVESLERGEVQQAVQLIQELNEARDRGLYQEVGKLTRELHNAIVNFQIDPRSVAKEDRRPGSVRGMAGQRAHEALIDAGRRPPGPRPVPLSCAGETT